jgi:hypothetical protein
MKKNLLLVIALILCLAATLKSQEIILRTATPKLVSSTILVDDPKTIVHYNFGDGTVHEVSCTLTSEGLGSALVAGTTVNNTLSISASGIVGLYCTSVGFSSIDVSNCATLDSLDCASNELNGLNLNANKALKRLNCRDNKLTYLDLSQNTALKYIHIGINQLTSIDLTANTELQFIDCDINQLTSLDLTKNTALHTIYCNNNLISSIYVNENSILKVFGCSYNKLDFATLPILRESWTVYGYGPQLPITIPENITDNTPIDLSKQLTVNGTVTNYTWRWENSSYTLTEGLDYSITGGITTFLKEQPVPVYCQMTNDIFPQFVLMSTPTTITFPTAIDNNMGSIKDLYVFNKSLNVNMTSNAHLLLCNVDGRILYETNIFEGRNKIELPYRGILIVRIKTDNKVTAIKIVGD